MNRWTSYAVASAMVLTCPAATEAWERVRHEDAAVVERSEAIVVGRLDKDSIKYVPRDNTGHGRSWQYHATLVVSETLKGSLKDRLVAIVIHYGLDPLVGGVGVRPDKSLYPGPAPSGFPPGRIDIVDSGNSLMVGPPVLENAQKDNLWFLRHLGGELGRERGKGGWGIVDPEDVQPLRFKDYFKCFLSDDVEKGIDRLLANPDEAVGIRALRYLAARHRPGDAQRIARLLGTAKQDVQTAAAEAPGGAGSCRMKSTSGSTCRSDRGEDEDASILPATRDYSAERNTRFWVLYCPRRARGAPSRKKSSTIEDVHGGRFKATAWEITECSRWPRGDHPPGPVQSRRRHVVPDAAPAALQIVVGQEVYAHVAVPPSKASRSISPALIDFRVSISPEASRLDRAAMGLPNIFWATASSRRTPRPLIWRASCWM